MSQENIETIGLDDNSDFHIVVAKNKIDNRYNIIFKLQRVNGETSFIITPFTEFKQYMNNVEKYIKDIEGKAEFNPMFI